MRTRSLCGVLFVAALATVPVQAAPVYYGFSNAWGNAVNNSGPNDWDEFNGAVPGSIISYSGANAAGIIEPSGAWSAGGQGTGTATVNAGGMHLTAYGSATLVNALGFVGADGVGYATGRFKDSFSLAVPGCAVPALCGAGAFGTLTVAVNVHGAVSASGSASPLVNGAGWNAYAQWAASLSVLGAGPGPSVWSGGQRYEAYPDDSFLRGFNIAYPYAPFGSYTLTLPVIIGNNVSVDLFGVVSAFGLAAAGSSPTNANAGGAANLGSTIAWGGILGLLDSQGDPITGFTALSADTGFDFRNAYAADVAAVPLPPALPLLIGGVSLLAAAQGRRRKLLGRAATA